MEKVVLLCRVSTQAQDYQYQVNTLTELAEKKGWKVLATFATNLGNYWRAAEFDFRQTIHKICFPGGLNYSRLKSITRTNSENYFLSVIRCYSDYSRSTEGIKIEENLSDFLSGRLRRKNLELSG